MTKEAALQEIFEDYAACERGEFSLTTLAFTVATMVVKNNDTGVLDLLPEDLRDAVLNIARAYRRDGVVVSQSSIGRAFHNELGSRLATLLNARFGVEGY